MQSDERLDLAVESVKAAPPFATGFPIVGSIPQLLHRQVDFFLDAWHKHGDIYTLNLGTAEMVVLNHPDFAQQVLRDNARNYSKGGSFWNAVRSLIGNGLVASEGEYWRKQRRMIQPQFHRQYLAGLVSLMDEGIEESIADWDGFAYSGKVIDVSQLFPEITMNVIMKTMFGRRISAEEMRDVGEAFRISIRHMPRAMLSSRFPDWLPIPGRGEYQDALSTIDKFVYRIIAERRENPGAYTDIVSMMIQMVDDETNEAMSDVEIRDEVVTLFGAGYETTSLAMAWGSYVLGQEVDVQQRLVDHFSSVLQGGAVSFENLMQMDYGRMVFSEILRLYPSSFWFPRMAVDEDVIGGYRIKAGQLIAIVPLTIHRHPQFWSDAGKFDPNRFSAEAERNHSLAWMPFGAGQRQCIGKDFAMMEGVLILAKLMTRYQVLPVEGYVPQFGLSSTLEARDGIWIRLKAR